MADVEPFPFAKLEDLQDRWPDFPPGADEHATVLLEDASQFILDVCPTAKTATEATRRRIVCSVVRRSMEASQSGEMGMSSWSQTTGPFQQSLRPVNPSGDFYLTKSERKALGEGRQKAFGGKIAESCVSEHLPWCSIAWGGPCSCGTDIAGYPIFEDA